MRKSRFAPTALAALLALLALLPLSPSSAQDLARRLILKDGSYQLVTKYEVKGERVRYFSAEREDWEELPASLVDWPATEKYERDRAAGASAPEAVQLDKELAKDEADAEAARPQVAPGLHLPEDSGVFILDSFQGEPQLVEIQQTAGDIHRNTKANIFRGAINPVAGLKQTIELDGPHATVQAHAEVPSLYINLEESPDKAEQSSISLDSARPEPPKSQQPQQPQQAQQPIVPFDRFRIVHAEVKGSKRIVGDVKRAVTGKISQEQHWVKTTIARVSGGWLKLTPTESLAPGEYALVEMMPKEGMNLYVWDFGVNPKAPANSNPWRPEIKPTQEAKPKASQP